MGKRKPIPKATSVAVLTEAGFRCAVPTCRTILAIDLHHLVQVSKGGTNDVQNLLALCPTCHALHHRGVIPAQSLQEYKRLIVSLSAPNIYTPIVTIAERYNLGPNHRNTGAYISYRVQVDDKDKAVAFSSSGENDLFIINITYSVSGKGPANARDFDVATAMSIICLESGEEQRRIVSTSSGRSRTDGTWSYTVSSSQPFGSLKQGTYTLSIYDYTSADGNREYTNMRLVLAKSSRGDPRHAELSAAPDPAT